MEGRGRDIHFGSKITHNEQNETTTSPPEYETIAMWNFDTFPRASGIRRAFRIARRNKLKAMDLQNILCSYMLRQKAINSEGCSY